MLGDIDHSLKPIEPNIFVAKPNREIIAKVSEAYGVSRKKSISQLHTFTFKIPFYISQNNALIRNRNADIIRERYHIKILTGQKEEWFIITKITDVTDDRGDSKEIECVYLPQELNDKLIGGYSEDSKHARQVLNDILIHSPLWSIGFIDADFELSYRSWEFPDNTLLDAIFQVAEKYNAIIEWDTVNRTFDLIKPELHGINRLGTLSRHKYIKSIDKESNAEIVVTRLRPSGKDGLGIERLTVDGSPNLEDFSFWKYPFQRDENKNVIRSSYYMSDSLCNALLDYEELKEDYDNQFGLLIEQIDNLTSDLSRQRTELVNLKNQLASITQIQLAQQFDKKMFFEKYSFTGSTYNYAFPVNNLYHYAVLIKVDDVIGKSLYINGEQSYMASGIWVMSKKINRNTTNINVSLTGAGQSGVFIQVVNISQQEFDTNDNGLEIVDKYNFDNKEIEISAKETQIQNTQNQINSVNSQISTIRETLSVYNNFTTEQIQELDKFIYEQRYVDETLIEDTDLLSEAKKRFQEYQRPQLELKIDIINFLNCIEEQRNWNQLYLGDKVIIQYDVFDMRIEAKIIEINYDYEKDNIELVISNFKDLSTETEQLEKYIYDSNKTTTIVNDNKHKWNKAIVDNSEFSQIFENFWDKTTNQINMAVNQTVQIADNGITITDHNDPLRFLRLTNGALGLTRSGGLRYETAITADGLIAEMVLGKLILGQRITIGDEDGIWLTEGAKTTITDRCGREVMKLGLYEENPDLFGMTINRFDKSSPCDPNIINRVIVNSEDGFTIQQKQGSVFNNVAWLDMDGLLNVKKLQIDYADGVLSNGIEIDSTNGITVTRSDIMSRSLMSGTRGFVIQQNVRTPQNPDWRDRFSVDGEGRIIAQSIQIKDSFVTDSGFEGGYLILRDGIGGVGKWYPSEGFWMGHENFANAPFSVTPTGKFKLAGRAGSVFIDTEAGYMDLNNLNIIGAGRIEANSIIVDTVISGTGFISNLAVNKLITFGKTDTVGQLIDYVHIQDNYIKLKTGEIKSRTQVTSDGKKLYWSDASRVTATDQVTAYPIWSLDVDDKTKFLLDHKGTGVGAYPRQAWGQGDGMVTDPSVADGMGNIKSARGFIEKPQNRFDFMYFSSNNAKDRSLSFDNSGVIITSEDGLFNTVAKNYQIGVTDGGNLSIKHVNGLEIELASNGRMKIKSSVGIDFDAPSYMFT